LCVGGWFPIALSIVIFIISAIWFYGRQRKSMYAKDHAQHLESILQFPDSRYASQDMPGLTTAFNLYQGWAVLPW